MKYLILNSIIMDMDMEGGRRAVYLRNALHSVINLKIGNLFVGCFVFDVEDQ
jgi:hypothetical protein